MFVYEVLRIYRKAAGLKTYEVAGMMSVSPDTYCKWEHGLRKQLTEDQAARLAFVVGIDRKKLDLIHLTAVTGYDEPKVNRREDVMQRRLRDAREANQLTQKEVSERLNVAYDTVRKWENGIISNIPYDKVEKLASIYGVRPTWLLAFDDEPYEVSDLYVELNNRTELHALLEEARLLSKNQVDALTAMVRAMRQ